MENEIAAVHGLTPADVLILKAMSYGVQDREISDLTGFDYETVLSRLRVIRRELRAKNAAHCVANALREGIIK